MDKVLVTGASYGGIGGAVCRALAAPGVKMVISATGSDPGLERLYDELAAVPAMAIEVIPGNLMEAEFAHDLVHKAAGWCDGLDTVVSCAGRSQAGSLMSADLADFYDTFDIHVRAPWLLACAAHDYLAAAGGSFTAIGSVTGTFPHQWRGMYPAAKAAQIMFCQTLAAEWASDGIRVNVVSPGLVSTSRKPKPWAADVVPLGREGLPEDVAEMVKFLSSMAASHVTGQNIIVDGGLTGAGLERAIRG